MSKLDSKPVIFFNAVAVKQYAIFEESNPKFRNYMEDSTSIIIQHLSFKIVILKAVPSLYSLESLMVMEATQSVSTSTSTWDKPSETISKSIKKTPLK